MRRFRTFMYRSLLIVLCLLVAVSSCHGAVTNFQKKTLMDVHPPPGVQFNHTIVIGVPISYDIRDIFFSQGRGMINAWELYIEWVNNKGGVSLLGENVSISLSYIEDYSSRDYVVSGVQYLLTGGAGSQQPVDLFLAPYSSVLTNITAIITEASGKLLVAGGSVNPAVFKNRPRTFGTLPPAYLYVEAAFRSLRNFQAPRVAVLRDVTEQICSEAEMRRVSQLHPDVQLYGFYHLDPASPLYITRVAEILGDLKANGVESVIGCSYIDLCIQIPSISKAIDYNPHGMMFIVCDHNPGALAALGDDIEYVLGMVPWVSTVRHVDEFVGWSSSEFQAKYRTAYSSDPTDVTASAFAGLEILVASIEAAQSLDADVLAAQLSSRSFATFYANLTFDDNHQGVLDLLVRQTRFNDSVLQTGIIVDPPDMALAEVVWPAPTWKKRACEKDTDSCSGHGACSSLGQCECQQQYFGSTPSTFCDSFCVGEMSSTGQCHADRVFYIGGLVSAYRADTAEIISTMQLAVELVNNHSDGWFDSVQHITFVLRVEDSQCSVEGGERATKLLNDWAVNESSAGTTLDGLVGALCSDASKGAARFGNTIFVPQLSYWSTSPDLSDKDEYIYFGRTCFTDDVQAQMLVQVLADVGLVPFLSVVKGSGAFLASLAARIVSNYEGQGHTVLTVLELPASNSSVPYHQVLDQLAAVGSPATALVMHPAEVEKLLAAAALHPAYGSDGLMVWVGIENWVAHDDVTTSRKGMLGVMSPYLPSNGTGPATTAFLELWRGLDPAVYIDVDGDRSSVNEHTLFVADAVFALALAYQQLIEEETGLAGDLLKKHAFTVLTQQVAFDGVSGPLSLLSNGDRDQPVFAIVNYGESSWIENGFVDKTGAHVLNYDAFLWPDNSRGKLAGNAQNELRCPAGTESIVVSSTPKLSSCSPCGTGSYKATAGSHACTPCPAGTTCTEAGVVVPCISPSFWRAEPPPREDDTGAGDFHNYRVYSCDIPGGCVGGCDLSQLCGSGRAPLSVSCGVCLEGFYLNYEGSCVQCKEEDMYSPAEVLVVYAAGLVLIGAGYLVVVKIFSKGAVQALQESFAADQDDVDDDAGLGRSSFTKHPSALNQIYSAARRMGDSASSKFTKQNFRDTMITGKIVLAFLQVMGVFFLLDLAWSSAEGDARVHDLFTSYNINVFRGNEHVIACSEVSSVIPPYYFIVLNSFFAPLAVLLIFASISACFFHYHLRRVRLQALSRSDGASGSALTAHQASAVDKMFLDIWAIFSRLVLWMCLVVYPSVCSVLLSVFNCRDFGHSGIFLRADNSVSCEDAEYRWYLALASCGVVLYIVGIPSLFLLAIRNRHHRLWRTSAMFLHHGNKDRWKYYEIFDLLRKLLITSVSQFVASPSSPSQVLFLLVVDLAALYLVSVTQPFLSPHDDHLSATLIGIECLAFSFAFLSVSGVSETEGFNELALQNTLLVMVLAGLVLVAPYTYIMKIEFFRARLGECCSLRGSQQKEDTCSEGTSGGGKWESEAGVCMTTLSDQGQCQGQSSAAGRGSSDEDHVVSSPLQPR